MTNEELFEFLQKHENAQKVVDHRTNHRPILVCNDGSTIPFDNLVGKYQKQSESISSELRRVMLNEDLLIPYLDGSRRKLDGELTEAESLTKKKRVSDRQEELNLTRTVWKSLPRFINDWEAGLIPVPFPPHADGEKNVAVIATQERGPIGRLKLQKERDEELCKVIDKEYQKLAATGVKEPRIYHDIETHKVELFANVLEPGELKLLTAKSLEGRHYRYLKRRRMTK